MISSPAGTPMKAVQIGSRRVTGVPKGDGGSVNRQKLGALILGLRLHDVDLNGCTVEAAATRLADHVERQGPTGQLLSLCFVEVGQRAWTPDKAVHLAAYLDGLTSPDHLTLRRGALEAALLGLVRSDALRWLGILRQCDAVRERLGLQKEDV